MSRQASPEEHPGPMVELDESLDIPWSSLKPTMQAVLWLSDLVAQYQLRPDVIQGTNPRLHKTMVTMELRELDGQLQKAGSLGKNRETGDKFRRKDCNVNIDGMVRTAHWMNLQPGLELLMKPSNRRFPRTLRPKGAPFVVIEGIDSSGKTTHIEAIAIALSQQHYPVRVITFPNNLTPLGRFLKHILQKGSSLECWTQHVLFSLHRWEIMDLIQDSLLGGTAVICERYAWSGAVYSYVSNPKLLLEAYMNCDQGAIQPDIVTPYQQVHYVCLFNDDQAVTVPICRACASAPDPDREELVVAEAPCPPDGEPRREDPGEISQDVLVLDPSGVVPCPNHGMDHLTRDPSCEFCKKALGPLYQHLKSKYGLRLDDQTPTLSFDFSGPFPVSATGARFMLLFVWRLADIRLLWAFALDRRTKENVRSCLQDVMAELTEMTGGSKPPVMRVHSDQAGEFLSPVVMEWLKQHNVKQTFTSGYDPAANGVAERWIDLVKIKATVLLAANHLSTAYWNYAVAWVTYAYNNKVLSIPMKKSLPEFGQLILVKSKRDHRFQDKGSGRHDGYLPKDLQWNSGSESPGW